LPGAPLTLADAVPLAQCGRALVIKLGSHRDVLFATPVFSVLKARGIEADALVYDDTAPMLEGHPAMSRLQLFGRGWSTSVFRALRARRYGLILHLCDHPRGAWLARTLGARYSVAPLLRHPRPLWKKSFSHLYLVAARRPEVELNLDALRRIGVYPQAAERKPTFVPGAQAEQKIRSLVKSEFVQVHAAPGMAAWPATKQAALVDRLASQGCQVVITCAPQREEQLFVDELVQAARSRPLNLGGRLSVKELGALSAQARLFYGPDTMPLHLACAMGTPAVLLSSTGDEVEWRPWDSADTTVRELAAS
jgi:heptosyltransferase III